MIVERSFRSFDPEELSKGKLYDFLVAAVQPRPIAFVSTINPQGHPNLAPFSFYVVGGSNPPSLAFSVTNSGQGHMKDTLRNILQEREFVVNSVHADMAQGMNATSFAFGYGVSEWDASGFTPVPSELVKPPRVKESRAQFECRLHEHVPHGDGPGSANYVIGEIVRIHLAEEVLSGEDIIPERLRTLARLGGPNYLDTEELRMFALSRPIGPVVPEED